ncbi:hypothetical protein J7643_16220 [bacterium]|nr:hypothetical protein [bacterium]
MRRALLYAALPLALTFVQAPAAEATIKRDLKTLDLSQAEQSLGRGGPEFKAIFNQAGDLGTFVGGRGVGYLTESLYLGGAGYGGALSSGGVSGGFGYGGMVVGTEGKIAQPLAYDVSLLFGGGGGGSARVSGGSFLLEPTVSLRQDFGGGVSGALSVGYLYVPQVNSLSGVTVGLRLDFKRLTLTLPIEN